MAPSFLLFLDFLLTKILFFLYIQMEDQPTDDVHDDEIKMTYTVNEVPPWYLAFPLSIQVSIINYCALYYTRCYILVRSTLQNLPPDICLNWGPNYWSKMWYMLANICKGHRTRTTKQKYFWKTCFSDVICSCFSVSVHRNRNEPIWFLFLCFEKQSNKTGCSPGSRGQGASQGPCPERQLQVWKHRNSY